MRVKVLVFLSKNFYSFVDFSRDFYRAHLKKYPFFHPARRLFLYFISLVYKINVCFLKSRFSVTLPLIKFSDFKKLHEVKSTLKREKEEIILKGPEFIKDSFRPQEPSIIKFTMPDIEVFELGQSVVIGGTDLIICSDKVVYPDIIDFKKALIPAEINKFIKINLDKELITIFFNPHKRIDKAISLLGNCTGNYAHWLTETLPKIMFSNEVDDYKNLPILVDAWVHPNFIDSIKLVCGNNCEIIKVNYWQSISVNNLISVTPSAYIPPENRDFLNTGVWSKVTGDVYPVSPWALNALRTLLQKSVFFQNGLESSKALPKVAFKKRIYLQRKKKNCGNIREVTNRAAYEKILKKYNFFVFDPADYTFSEQVKIFTNAEYIISESGSALANLIFAKPGCKALILAAYYKNANYYYYSNLLEALGHQPLYFVGAIDAEIKGHPYLNGNFIVDLKNFKKAVEQLIKL